MKAYIRSLIVIISLMTAATTGFATDGMNIEGYGPIAQALGGASYAYDNGNAAVINNPATLSLQSEGNRLDVAVGFLGPNVSATAPGASRADSNEDAYFMPAAGWSKKEGSLTYGIGIFAQGGMGTQFSSKSFLALNSGDEVRAEVSVGRLIVPLSYEVNEDLAIGATIDFVWAGMDLKMAVPGALAPQLVTGGNLPLPALGQSDYLRLDFSDDTSFSGDAKGYGAAGKIGFVYKLHDRITLGGVYHSRTDLQDLETDDATVSFGSSLTGQQAGSMKGRIDIRDFEWPETYGLGVAVQATDRLLLVLDVKQIEWSDVMENLSLTFHADAGGSIDLALPQNWDYQTVYSLGAAFALSEKWTVRAGFNKTDNPIPDQFVNPLFPAVVEDHITAGFGYTPNDSHSINVSGVYAPDVSVTNGDGITIEHSQISGQLMYTYRY